MARKPQARKGVPTEGSPSSFSLTAHSSLALPPRTCIFDVSTTHPETPMSLVNEFKACALRGNMVGLAVGIVIGGAFVGVVKSLVDDVMMPPLGILIGGVDFKDLAVTLRTATADAPAVMLRYGAFINT